MYKFSDHGVSHTVQDTYCCLRSNGYSMHIRDNTVLRLVVADYRDMCTRIKYESELKVRAEREEKRMQMIDIETVGDRFRYFVAWN